MPDMPPIILRATSELCLERLTAYLEKAFYFLVLGAALTLSCWGQVFTSLVSLEQSQGTNPQFLNLIQGADGDYYGTATFGGSGHQGTIFKITAAGSFTVLHNFIVSDGASPHGSLVQLADGYFYGTTELGGAYNSGTVYKMSPKGDVTTLYSFTAGADGAQPFDGLVWASDGNLYGTTDFNGAFDGGTVFKITPKGVLTTLHSFSQTDGASPLGGLVQGGDGSLYGTTQLGGANNYGTIYKITLQGTLTTIHDFNLVDGSDPFAVLVEGLDGNLYGTSSSGGAYDSGTVFKVTLDGTLTTLHSFCSDSGCADGAYPIGALVQANDGNFYGTTTDLVHHVRGHGTIFQISPAGDLATIHTFDITDGSAPHGGLLQATRGPLYGTTYAGGVYGLGTLYSLDMGLAPFVALPRDFGRVGQTVAILGQGLRQGTSVSFNGSQAKFVVKSNTCIFATVPAGATTGPVKVMAPKGTLTSNKPFRVLSKGL
jgi:uncharacterized repeat protein (TIGR03803 family)